MSIYKKVLVLMMSYFLLLNPVYSGVGGVGFATEYTQLLNNIQMGAFRQSRFTLTS